MSLWARTPGVGLGVGDSVRELTRFLARNDGLSFVALDGDTVVGTILAGHDGRRAYLYHVCVEPAYQGRGIGRCLCELSLQALSREGIGRVHCMVFGNNAQAHAFWRRLGFCQREDLHVMTKTYD